MLYRHKQTDTNQPGVAEGLNCNLGQTGKRDNHCRLHHLIRFTERPDFSFLLKQILDE